MYALSNLEVLLAACIVITIGRVINHHWSFLHNYHIPVAVTGGIIISTLIGLLYFTTGFEFSFANELSDFLLLSFFATIGLSAKIRLLFEGGRLLFILIIVIIFFLIIQNIIGVGGALAMGLDPLIGLLSGSITLSGGHGTGISYALLFENQFGMNNAIEIAMATATFGLVMGGLLGGPLATLLIKRYDLKSAEQIEQDTSSVDLQVARKIRHNHFIEKIAMIVICVLLGPIVNQGLSDLTMQYWNKSLLLPDFVPTLFIGVIIVNLLEFSHYKFDQTALSVCSKLSLNLFLAIALMKLQLWTLVDLAIPLIVILTVQVIFAWLFVFYIVFRTVGKNYCASVISAGYIGFGLGATPTAMANMSEITKHYGMSTQAFIVIPLIGAFFIDIANAIVIQTFLLLPYFG